MKNNGSLGRKRGHTIGRKGFAKISAVEGVRLTAAMEADFRGFDKEGLRPSKRRKLIAAKYGRTRPR